MEYVGHGSRRGLFEGGQGVSEEGWEMVPGSGKWR